jgi:hypothetical protein
MQEISGDDIRQRIQAENPWWSGEHSIASAHKALTPRAYFDLFLPLLKERGVRRALF